MSTHTLPTFIVGTIETVMPADPKDEHLQFFVSLENRPKERVPVSATGPLARWLNLLRPQPGTNVIIRGQLLPVDEQNRSFYVKADRLGILDPKSIEQVST